jgi:hypothetical protein
MDNLWWIAVPGLFVVLALLVVGALWVTSDGHVGGHRGVDTYPAARHRAQGMNDPTTQIVARGRARVEENGQGTC